MIALTAQSNDGTVSMNQEIRAALSLLVLVGVDSTAGAAELTPAQLAVLNVEQAEAIAWAKRDVDSI